MNFWSVLLISVVYFYTKTVGLVPQKIPESWKCADPTCSVRISEAKPVLKQYSSLKNLSVKKDQKVTIYGKGSKTYDVEVDGKRGYIPKYVVIETRVFVKDGDLKHIVTHGSKVGPKERTTSETQVDVNGKVPSESKVQPTVDLGNFKPEMPPVMQGAFLLAGAAADDSEMSSSTKIPDAVSDAFKNEADASPPEYEKSLPDTPAAVEEPDVFDDEVEPDEKIEDDGDVFDANILEDNVTGTTGSVQPKPAETNFEATGGTVVDPTKDTTVDSSKSAPILETLNVTTVESLNVTVNDTKPYLVSEVDNTTDDIVEKESVDQIREEAAKIEEANYGSSLFSFLGGTVDTTKEVDKKEEESEKKVGVEEPLKKVGEESGKKVEKESEKKVGVEEPLKKVVEESGKKVEKESEKKVEEESEKKEVEETEKKEVEETEKKEERDTKKDIVEENTSAEDVNMTENKVFEGVKLPVGIEIDLGVEKESAKSSVEDTAKRMTEEGEKPDKVEEKQTEKIVEPNEPVVQKELNLDYNYSSAIEADNATESEPVVGGASEPVVGGVYEPVVGGTYEQEKNTDRYNVAPEQKDQDKDERAGRVKRDFMYQQNQYAYNSHPNYQQQRNYGGRMNDYNTNNYRQYQTDYPNSYPYQQHANFEGNMHHSNIEANMHHQNMYHNHANTQSPPKVETSSARTIEPEIPVPSTQETPSTTESAPVTSEPDHEDVSVEVDDHSGEVVTDTSQEEKKEETIHAPIPETSTETAPSTDEQKLEVAQEEEEENEPEVVKEEEKVEEHPGESTEPQEDTVVSSEEPTESGGGWFSLKTITDIFASGKSDDDSKPIEETSASTSPSIEEEPKLPDEKCSTNDVSCELDKLEEKLLDGELLSSGPFIAESDDLLGALMDSLQKTSSGPIFVLIVTACAVVGFSLGYNFIENRKREGVLVAKINSLEKENLVEKKEKNQLKDKLQHVCETSTLSSEAEASYLSQIATLTEERNTLIAEKRDLEDQLMETERDLQTATESNLEMNNLLSESLSTPDGSTVLLETVETLKAKLENQNIEVKELNRLLNEKSEEIDSIRKELKVNQEAKKLLQEKLTALKREKDEELLQLKESNRDLSTQLDDLMESRSLEKLKLSNELSKLQITLTETQTMLGDRNGEIDALKDVISRLKSNLKEEELNSLYDVASISGKLTQAEAERDCFKEKFLEEEGARKLLEGHVEVISQEVASLKENYEAAEKEKIEALTKVQVLSNYFKEKETQLQNELGLKESMWLQKQSDDNTIYEQMKSLREENERYKSQLESLQKEIRESETDYKSQVAKAEQKSYENWLTSRQFERKLKESQGEATQLRNMLTLIEKNSTNHSTDDLKQSISESNGAPSSPPPRFLPPPPTSPPFMMFQPPPPPHHDYIPPPPLVYPEVAAAASAARPPTLGRISSPPLDHPRFSPPPPHHMPPPYLFDPSPSPPPPHRPLPKPHMSADHKESISPGYSDHHERPNRRSKR